MPPGKKENHLQMCLFEGYVSSQGGYIYNLITNIAGVFFVKRSDLPQIKGDYCNQPEMFFLWRINFRPCVDQLAILGCHPSWFSKSSMFKKIECWKA